VLIGEGHFKKGGEGALPLPEKKEELGGGKNLVLDCLRYGAKERNLMEKEKGTKRLGGGEQYNKTN